MSARTRTPEGPAKPRRPEPRHVCVTCAHWSHGCLLQAGPRAARAERWLRQHVHRKPSGLPVSPPTSPPCPGWSEAWPQRTDWMRGGVFRYVPHGFDLSAEEVAAWRAWAHAADADDADAALEPA